MEKWTKLTNDQHIRINQLQFGTNENFQEIMTNEELKAYLVNELGYSTIEETTQEVEPLKVKVGSKIELNGNQYTASWGENGKGFTLKTGSAVGNSKNLNVNIIYTKTLKEFKIELAKLGAIVLKYHGYA
jgi:hypothetical protein